MSENYRLERTVADEKWDDFVKNSENGTLFLYSDYLNALDIKKGLYYFYNNQEVRAALAVIEDESGENAILHDFVIYSGIIFGSQTSGQNRAQRISEQFKIAEFIANKLPELYQSIDIALHPSWIDVRPFLWVNYGTEQPKYSINIRYTSYLDISDFDSVANIEQINAYKNASKARRQEIRYAIRDNIKTEEIFSPLDFITLYKKTFLRQNTQIDESKLDEMKVLLNGLEQAGLLTMIASYSDKNKIASMACFGTDNKRSYYIFGASDPDLRDTHAGTAVLWDGFSLISKRGTKVVDLEGVNSPQRGWFKLSFGGNLLPYYEVGMQQQ